MGGTVGAAVIASLSHIIKTSDVLRSCTRLNFNHNQNPRAGCTYGTSQNVAVYGLGALYNIGIRSESIAVLPSKESLQKLY